jgi:hypothetical protein
MILDDKPVPSYVWEVWEDNPDINKHTMDLRILASQNRPKNQAESTRILIWTQILRLPSSTWNDQIRKVPRVKYHRNPCLCVPLPQRKSEIWSLEGLFSPCCFGHFSGALTKKQTGAPMLLVAQ